MYLRRDEVEPERRTSPLALRISIITALAIAIFSVLFLRLWYVQVLSGDKYRNQANDNRIREIRVQAPRGDILDRNGKVLVANRTELAIQVTPQDLPPPGPDRSRELKQLATVTGMTMKEIRKDACRRQPRRARRPGDPQEGPRRRQGLLPAREPVELSRRERGARLHPRVPAGHARGAPLRERRRGDRRTAQAAPLLGPPSRGPGRPVGGRVRVRPLPARQTGHRPRAGGRARQADRAAAQHPGGAGRRRPADHRLESAGDRRGRPRAPSACPAPSSP